MAESPHGQGRTPSTEAHWGPLRAAPKRVPHYGRRCFYTATWGAAKRHAKSLCQDALVHSPSLVWRWPSWGP
eukprot:12842581-Alexandrium_andersonii.AAC.1